MTKELPEKALREAIAAVVQLLDAVGESYWSRRLRGVDCEGIDADVVLSLFGGMGSFNDLVIAAVNGNKVRRDDESETNRRIDELRERIYALARELKKDPTEVDAR